MEEQNELKNKNEKLNIIEGVRQLIENDQEIPLDYCRMLFPPQKREYELTYYGKESVEQIMSGIKAVPLQEDRILPPNSVVNENDWVNKLIFGENSQILQTLIKMKKDGKLKNSDGTDGVRLIYIDPPFATKQEFKISGADQVAYADKMSGATFIEFLRKRLILARELLSDDGSIFVHLDGKMCHYIKVIMDEIFEKNNFVNEIIWQYYMGGKGTNEFAKKHDTILYYAKNKGKHIFKQQMIKRYYDFKPTLKDESANGKNGHDDLGYWGMIKCPDVWQIRGVFNMGGEYTAYPTQKPELLLQRIIETTSNCGDIVLDFFAGSGTTPAVAEKLNRRWIAIDVGKYAIYTIQKRLLSIKTINPFILYFGGLYDSEKLNNFDSENWKLFSMQLWDCQPNKKILKGIVFDGKKDNCFVKVYTPQELKNSGAKISINTITEIDNIIGNNLGNEIYIIAPQGQFDFAEDDLEVKDRIYHILRVPYSLLAKFTENFTPAKQPQKSDDINEIVDAVGFDFVQPPFVDFDVKDDKLIIKEFKSNSRLKGEQKTELSMILIDYNYNNEIFDLDQILFNNDLYEKDKENNSIKFKEKITINKIKDRAMLIFVDNAGNEKKVVVNGKKLRIYDNERK